MEATMRKFFLIGVVLLSATAAHAGLDVSAANADAKAAEAPTEARQPSSTPRPDAGALAAKRQGMMRQQMMMRKQMMMRRQMAMQQEMQRHPIRTRFHFALLRFKRKLHYAFH
jgi:hypothetical protein